MGDPLSSCRSIIARCRAGEISLEIALMEMLIATEDAALVARALSDLEAARAREDPPDKTLVRLRRMFTDNRDGCVKIANLLRDETLPSESLSLDAGLRYVTELFDRLVAQSEEASVALYSLGSADILARATDELVAWLDGYRLLTPTTRLLDFGCGIGRMSSAIAPRVAQVDAVDLSTEMVASASERCRAQPNVCVHTCSGRELGMLESASLDLSLAVDSFPYVVRCGRALVDLTFAELARVLVPGGHLALFNFAYDRPLSWQRDKVTALAKLHGFRVELSGMQPFSLWNGTAFLLRRDRTKGAAGRRSTPMPEGAR